MKDKFLLSTVLLMMCATSSSVSAGAKPGKSILPETPWQSAAPSQSIPAVQSTEAAKHLHKEGEICGTDHNSQNWPQLQSQLSKQLRDPKSKASKIMQQHHKMAAQPAAANGQGLAGRYYIPVVVHIYGAQFNCEVGNACLTDEKVIEAIRKTSEDFLGTNTQDGPIPPEFQAIRDNLNVEFVLAKKDPAGNPTNGIVRHNREQAGYGEGSAFNAQIAADAWDNYKYMNVYIMNDLYADGSTNNSGVAWYPEVAMSNAGLSRVVYNGWYLGSNTNENFRSVLTHEFGHWLNLPHTFDGNECSLANETFCALSGDRSCDTPQMGLSSIMQNNVPNCLGKATNTENFMHYSDNYAMFTQDQVERMVAALHSPARITLWSNANLMAAGLDEYTSNEPHNWDGSGTDSAPEGEDISRINGLSGAKDDIDTFPVQVPAGTQALAIYLDGFTEDPDMYVSKGQQPTPPATAGGDWTADHISFNAAGQAEFVGLLAPSAGETYYTTVHAFSAYQNANLAVIAVDDPLLCEGCRRETVLDVKNLESAAGATPKTYQFIVPANASKVSFALVEGYYGDPDLHVSQNKAVSLESFDCRPFSAPQLSEYCEFSSGGTFNVMIDPYLDYGGVKFRVYYEISDNSNAAPVAMVNGPYTATTQSAVQFSSLGSADADGSISAYLWDFGDGNSSTETNPSHLYAAAGSYNVSLQVTDNEGQNHTASTIATISAAVRGDWDKDGDVDNNDIRELTKAIQANQVIDLSFDINLDGKINMLDVRAMTALCTYAQCASAPAANVAPVAVLTAPASALLNTEVQLSSQGSADADGNIVAYLWQFGDGQSSTAANPSHSYNNAGVYQLSLTVTDNGGQSHTATASLNISAVANNLLPDSCTNQAAISGGRLTPGLVECISVQGDLWLSLPEMNQHQSVAITVAHGQGNAALYFRQGNWPNASTFDAKSDNAGTTQCIYINNLSQSGDYWAYLRLTGQSAGSSIMLDFDTPGCRNSQ